MDYDGVPRYIGECSRVTLASPSLCIGSALRRNGRSGYSRWQVGLGVLVAVVTSLHPIPMHHCLKTTHALVRHLASTLTGYLSKHWQGWGKTKDYIPPRGTATWLWQLAPQPVFPIRPPELLAAAGRCCIPGCF